MYYHVYVEYLLDNGKNQIREEAYVKNIEDTEYLKNNFVKPFVSKKTEIIVNGHIVKRPSINIFKIMKSDIKLENIVANKNASVPQNVILIYSDEDVLKSGCDGLIDVTLDFVKLAD